MRERSGGRGIWRAKQKKGGTAPIRGICIRNKKKGREESKKKKWEGHHSILSIKGRAYADKKHSSAAGKEGSPGHGRKRGKDPTTGERTGWGKRQGKIGQPLDRWGKVALGLREENRHLQPEGRESLPQCGWEIRTKNSPS